MKRTDMTMKMMISALLVTCAITLSSSQNLTNDDITSICKAVTEQGNCSSCNWCSVRKDGFPLTVKDLCRVRNSPSDCSLALSDFPCSNITTFYSQSCSALNSWAHKIVCPIAKLAASCFVTTEASTTTVTTTTATTTTVPTTTKTIRFQGGARETFPEASTTTVTTTTATTTTVPTTTKTIRFQGGARETFPEASTTTATTTTVPTTTKTIRFQGGARETFPEASTTTVTTTTATTTTVPTTTKTIRFQGGARETFPEASTTTVTTTTATTTTVPTTTKTIRFQGGARETFPEASTTTVTTTTATTTTVLTTTTTTMPSIPGPDVARKTFLTPCTQRCVRNDIVASECGASTLPEACTNLDDSSLNGQYTCCTG
ncbi:salivary glue protein Sgs-3-like isoform X6 [Haliotis rufescens]|uniref:salivary glue protein Sgs-3-like isoform X6 n=1 Tax=Haliotis rufescens TaxID=6454 RepID=UPI00201F4552|nr:salivary glue protein Sgs-3-like isoform X6 [Haliotis rufescens]